MAETALTGMAASVADLKERREKARRRGARETQQPPGKLTPRERLDLLFDTKSFEEWGLHATHAAEGAVDGVVTGIGRVDGRLVAVIAYGESVSDAMLDEAKAGRIRETAMRQGIPLVWLLDAQSPPITGASKLFHDQAQMSGSVPQVAALLGHCTGTVAYIPALADFVPMVKGASSLALAGPEQVKASLGETVSREELGGSRVHCELSGVADLEVDSEEACLRVIKDYLSYFPDNCRQSPPVRPAIAPPLRSDEELLRILPDRLEQPYDMKALLSRVVDDGRYFELKPRFGQSVITALARLGGRSVGIVASQPKVQGGVLTREAADKAARFVSLCDAFNLPLIFFQDVPGFMPGSRVEKDGLLRHGARLISMVSTATVPKLTVIVRKAYGAGYHAMGGRAYEPDLIVAWPGAVLSAEGPESAVNPYDAASSGLIDDVIDPRETRRALLRGMDLTGHRHLRQPERKHGVIRM